MKEQEEQARYKYYGALSNCIWVGIGNASYYPGLAPYTLFRFKLFFVLDLYAPLTVQDPVRLRRYNKPYSA